MRRNIFSLVPLIFAITTNSCNLEEKAKEKSDNYSVQRGVNISHWLSQSNRRGEERRNFFLQKKISCNIGPDKDLVFELVSIRRRLSRLWIRKGG